MKFWTEYYLRYDTTIPRSFVNREQWAWMRIDEVNILKKAENNFNDQVSDIQNQLTVSLAEKEKLEEEVYFLKQIIEANDIDKETLELKYQQFLNEKITSKITEFRKLQRSKHPANSVN